MYNFKGKFIMFTYLFDLALNYLTLVFTYIFVVKRIREKGFKLITAKQSY